MYEKNRQFYEANLNPFKNNTKITFYYMGEIV